MIEFWIVQHGEKMPGLSGGDANDPGLTERGRRHAHTTAVFLSDKGVSRVYSSPLRRTRETAEPIGVVLDLPVQIDSRLRERMNWGDGGIRPSLAEFLNEWEKATRDREYAPAFGDSSRAAGERFAAMLEELVKKSGSGDGKRVVLVAHGGVTVDLVRGLFGDAAVRRAKADAIEHGLPGCGITRLVWRNGEYDLVELGSVAHLGSGATECTAG